MEGRELCQKRPGLFAPRGRARRGLIDSFVYIAVRVLSSCLLVKARRDASRRSERSYAALERNRPGTDRRAKKPRRIQFPASALGQAVAMDECPSPSL